MAAAIAGLAAGSAAWAAFAANDSNSGNAIASGTVAIGDNDSDGAALSLSSAIPGSSDTSCIKVTYSGSLPSTVRLYGAATGTGLDAYLTLKVTRGTYSGADPGFRSCTGFTADATDYAGQGPGVIYNGSLQAYPATYASGLADPVAGSPESWTASESHVYKLQVTLNDQDAAQGKTAAETFTWEARNQ